MAGWRRAVELALSDEGIATLTTLSQSRLELASRVSRAQMLLAYRENPSFCAMGQMRRRVSVAAPNVYDDDLENDLGTPAREITFRYRVDRRSLLPLAAPRDAVARNATSRICRDFQTRSVAVSAIDLVAACAQRGLSAPALISGHDVDDVSLVSLDGGTVDPWPA